MFTRGHQNYANGGSEHSNFGLQTNLLESSLSTCTVCKHSAHCESLYCSKPIRNKSGNTCTNCNHPHHSSYNSQDVCKVLVPSADGNTRSCECAVCSCSQCQPLTRCGCNHCYCDTRCLPIHRTACSRNIKFYVLLCAVLIGVALLGFCLTCVPTVVFLSQSQKRQAAPWVGVGIAGMVIVAYGVPSCVLLLCAGKNIKNYAKPALQRVPHQHMTPVGKDEHFDDATEDEIHLKTEADELSALDYLANHNKNRDNLQDDNNNNTSGKSRNTKSSSMVGSGFEQVALRKPSILLRNLPPAAQQQQQQQQKDQQETGDFNLENASNVATERDATNADLSDDEDDDGALEDEIVVMSNNNNNNSTMGSSNVNTSASASLLWNDVLSQ